MIRITYSKTVADSVIYCNHIYIIKNILYGIDDETGTIYNLKFKDDLIIDKQVKDLTIEECHKLGFESCDMNESDMNDYIDITALVKENYYGKIYSRN